MTRQRIKLEVYVDLDPVPGTFHTKESAQNVVRSILAEMIGHYNPIVSIDEKSYVLKSSWLGTLQSVTFETEDAAQIVLYRMTNIIESGGTATIAHLFQFVAQENSYIDYLWGWRKADVNGMHIVPNDNGYTLHLPTPQRLSQKNKGTN